VKTKVLCLFTLVLGFSTARGQNPDSGLGLIPYQTFHGSDFDKVNVETGLLNFDVPLFSYPQLGAKLKLSYSARFNSKYYSVVTSCDGVDPDCLHFLAHTANISQGPGNYIHSTTTPTSGFSIGDDQAVRVITTSYKLTSGGTGVGGAPVETNVYDAYQLLTSDGALHPMNSLYGTTDNLATTGPGTLLTVDGTGFREDSTGLRDSAGVLVSNGSSRTDPDGNTISGDIATGTQDSMGRSIPAMVATTDTSGCTGSLATTSASTWSVPGPNNSTQVFKFCYATAPAYIPASYCNLDDDLNTTQTVLQSIVLPNQLAWTFEYQARAPTDPSNVYYGEISKITMPTGGTIRYDYAMQLGTDGISCSASVTKRTVNDMTTDQSWTYSSAYVNFGVASVTDPNGNVTQTNFDGDGYETSTLYYSGSSSLLKEVDTAYLPSVAPITPAEVGITGPGSNVNKLPQTVTTRLDNGLAVSQKVYGYCCDFSFVGFHDLTGQGYSQGTYAGPYQATASYGIQNDEKDYDFGATGSGTVGPLLRELKRSSFLWQTNAGYLDANILDTPVSVITLDGAGNTAAQVNYGYDEAGYIAVPGAVLGHQTSTSAWAGASTYLTSHTYWNGNGLPSSQVDPKNNPPTVFSYSSAYNGAYLTTVTDALGHTMNYGYDFNSGVMTSKTDANNQTTSYTYDNIGRLIDVLDPATAPGRGESKYCYTDTGGPICSQTGPPFSFYTATTATPDPTITKIQNFDGLGRQVKSILQTAVPGPIVVDTTYDSLGRVASASNPYISTGDSTYGVTTYTYDPLNRKKLEVESDGTSQLHWSYAGNCTTSINEDNNSWIRCIDGLGRLENVLEPGGLSTSYGYNPLGDLTNVTQSGLTTETPRVRTFGYDPLSRLLNSNNPETGTIGYQYTASGALCAGDASLPCGKTNANGVTITYSYDPLNRLLSKASPNGPPGSFSSCYAYDAATNGTGRLSVEWTQLAACPAISTPQTTPPSSAATWREIQSYDSVGRITNEQQCAWAPCANPKALVYGYDVAGNLTSSTNGLPVSVPTNATAPGLAMTYAFDGAGRLSNITSNWSGPYPATPYPSTLFEADQPINAVNPYGPFGLTAAQVGVSSTSQQTVALTKTYDNRGRINGITATVQPPSSLPPGTPTIVSALNNVVLGTSPTVSIQDICNSACGSINFNVFGPVSDSGTAILAANGSGSFQISPSLEPGQYTLTVSFPGNTQYSAASSSIIFSVVAGGLPPTSLAASLSAAPVVQGTSPTLTTVLGCNSACGTVSYLLDGQALQASTVNQDGTVTPLSLGSTLAPGQHTVVVSYGGDTIHGSNAISLTFAVVSNIPTVSVSLDVNPVPAGETPRILTMVNCNACGTVNYALDGATFQQSSIGSDGSAVAMLTPQISNGSHLLTVSYPGNGAYQPTSTSLTFQVIPNNLPVPSLVASLQTSPVAIGTSPSVLAVLGCGNACGYVSYSMDGQVFQSYPVNADGTLPSPPISPTLSSGAHTLAISYGGNAVFAPASTSIPFNVVSAVSMTVTASLNVNPVPAGETPLMTTQVGCNASCGYMNYTVDGTLIQGSSILPDGSSGNVLSPSPAVGWHILTVTNVGDATHAAVSTSFAFQVVPDNLPVLSLVASLPTNPVPYGTSPGAITILGSNKSSASGFMSWYIDGTPMQRWQFSAGTFTGPPGAPSIPSNLPVGAHSLTVQYGGDGNFAPSSTTIPFTVVSAASMTVTASLNVNPVPVDETPLIRSQVSCNASCGYMNFAVDGTIIQGSSILSDGSGGNVLNPVPTVGWHILTATNVGNSTYAAASTSFAFQVIPDTLPVLNLVASLPTNPVIYGTTPALEFILGSNTASPTGFISFYVDGTLFQQWGISGYTAGAGPSIPSNLSVGAHTLTVHYGGDGNYAPATAIYPFTVVANQ
jgi:YD repeat-containing protein